MEHTIKIANQNEDILSCWDALSGLRPSLKYVNFLTAVKQMQQEGYTLIYISEVEKVIAVAGYRFLTMLYCGKTVYVDDLFTLPEYRGKGYATKLLVYMCEIGKKNSCSAIHLDSGHQRVTAHKLYYSSGFSINAYHFAKDLL